MRILLLSTSSPYPANNGVKMRSWSILRTLVQQGHRVTLVTFADQDENPNNALAEICEDVVWIPHQQRSVSSGGDYWGRLRHLFSRLPYGTQNLRSQPMAARLTELLASDAFDLIFSEQTDLLVNLPDRLAVPLIADFHNVDYLILERYIPFERNPAKRMYAALESRKMQAWERRTCRAATLAMACSEHDRALLQKMNPKLELFVVPNVIDLDRDAQIGQEDPLKILFQGGMDWYPNRDAVEFFAAKILPSVQRQIPGVRLVVAGRNPPEKFKQRLCALGSIEFTGTVADMRTEIATASVSVVPLRIGSGTRLKILEAAAMAKPIISTRVGAEGLDFVNGKEIILEDEPAAFAEAVVELLRSGARRQSLGSAARRRVEQQYSLAAMDAALRAAMNGERIRTIKNDCTEA
jgi:polysaccharide biosynthesis protein PslH